MSSLKPLWNGFTYFEHQVRGVQWMLEKERDGTMVKGKNNENVLVRGGVQADDMGLGKTIQMAGVMVNNPVKKTVLLAPLAMLDTWIGICKKIGMQVYAVNPKDPRRWTVHNPKAGIPRHFMRCRAEIYITNYEKMYTVPELFRQEFDRVVLDEAHKIRNADGITAIYARRLKAPLRWALTGTILVNSLKDVVSLLAFIGVPTSAKYTWEPRFKTMLPNLMIHRSMESMRGIIKDIPPVPVVHHMALPFTTEAEKDFYLGVQGKSASMLAKYGSEGLSSAQMFLLLLRLRQISVSPQVYINSKRREEVGYPRPDWNEPSTKMSAVKSIIEKDQDGEVHKYIIFCQFKDEMSLIRDYLLQENMVKDENIFLYHGSMNQKERRDTLERSEASTETTVILMQLACSAVGLNMQYTDRVIFVSPYWTSALMDQAVCRSFRLGQRRVVHVYHLHLEAEQENTINIDKMVDAKAEEKRAMLKKLYADCA
jgi:SNF2 family DNA or RNA helicase